MATDGEVATVTAPGLTAEEVAQRVAARQTNDVPDPRSRSLGSIFRENVFTSFNLVIGTLWVLMLVAQAPIQDSLFGLVIIFNSAIGIIQSGGPNGRWRSSHWSVRPSRWWCVTGPPRRSARRRSCSTTSSS